MSYRIEVSATRRAGCKAKRCKDNDVKIQKGELRMGVLVDFDGEHQSMVWRHWGCVTPTQLHNWWETAEHNIEMIDGLDELPEDAQQKIQTALEQGHVDDEEWNGDDGFNRYNPKNPNQGMYMKTPRKKKTNDAGDDAAAAATAEPDSPTKQPAKTAARKRGRNDEEDDDREVKPAKKTKATTKPKQEPADEEHVSENHVKPAKHTKNAAVKSAEELTDGPAPKKRQTKAKTKVKEEADADEAEAELVEQKPKARGKKAKPSADANTTAEVSKESHGKKTKAGAASDDHAGEEPKPKRKGRKATS